MSVRYVNHEQRGAYEALGWALASNGQRMGHHGYWSCLMEWRGEGDPQEPGRAPDAKVNEAFARATSV